MALVNTSQTYNALKRTLDKIITDKSTGESQAIYNKWMTVGSMSDNWHEDQEYGGPGLLSEKEEGAELQVGQIREGTTTRYNSRTYGGKLVVTEEALEDAKYSEVINAGKRLVRSMWKTVDVNTTQILVRGWDSNYVGGDGLSLFNASHTLPHGGTFSNTLATPLSPSVSAVIIVASAVKKLPGHDGITEGYNLKMVKCPTEQWAVWEQLVFSKFSPEAGNFSEINVVNRSLDLQICPNQYWTNTTTNWAMLTDAPGGITQKWRRRPRSRTYGDEDFETMKYACSARWSNGWSDPRGAYGSQA